VKTKVILLLIAAAAACALIYSWEPDPSVDGGYFQERFRAALLSGGLSTNGAEECNPQEAQAPLAIQWHPRRWYPHTPETDVVGGNDGVEHYTVMDRSSKSVDCFVRYIDGRASFIVIRAAPAAGSVANSLRAALAREFPDLPIELQTSS
jgi:hypothetical protein